MSCRQLDELNRAKQAYVALCEEADKAEKSAEVDAAAASSSPTMSQKSGGAVQDDRAAEGHGTAARPTEPPPRERLRQLSIVFSSVARAAATAVSHGHSTSPPSSAPAAADVPIKLGGETYTQEGISDFLSRMAREIPSQDVAPYALLGTFRGAISGRDLALWLESGGGGLARLRDDNEVQGVGQDLLDQGQATAAPIRPPAKFPSWSDPAKRDTLARSHSTKNRRQPPANLPIKRLAGRYEDDCDFSLRFLFPRADLQYRTAVKKTDTARTALIGEVYKHLGSMQDLEMDRLAIAKVGFCELAALQASILPVVSETSGRTVTYLEDIRGGSTRAISSSLVGGRAHGRLGAAAQAAACALSEPLPRMRRRPDIRRQAGRAVEGVRRAGTAAGREVHLCDQQGQQVYGWYLK
ncbi:MAG: hypothetical protein BJ554DRAFT_6037 [Olpidium bornovanus]|uniref:Uncharacterized protein n=1 Tax=Olpidium bornovanus TaxID=278681 RepID=A0A8H8DKJ0_9FUNG|nr:MAG: hypothetical protein BJ554DRAFT_6037 [Olpidium bornovanus]